MYPIDTQDANVTTQPGFPSGTVGFFNDDAGHSTGVITNVESWWLNMIQAELQNIVNEAGIVLNKATNTQVREAINIIIERVFIEIDAPAYWIISRSTGYGDYPPQDFPDIGWQPKLMSKGSLIHTIQNLEWYDSRSKLYTMYVDVLNTTVRKLYNFAVDDGLHIYVDGVSIKHYVIYNVSGSIAEPRIIEIPLTKGKRRIDIVYHNSGGVEWFNYTVGDIICDDVKFIPQ